MVKSNLLSKILQLLTNGVILIFQPKNPSEIIYVCYCTLKDFIFTLAKNCWDYKKENVMSFMRQLFKLIDFSACKINSPFFIFLRND